MAIKINFDNTNNVIEPTFVLLTRSGRKICKLPADNTVFKDRMNSVSELSFNVNKNLMKKKRKFWNQIVDFKLAWARDWNKLFEIYVEIDEANDIVKHISAKSLGEAELSQINLYDIEINTESDIEREDYEPTVLFNEERPNASLLHRIMEKAPHYTINYVSSSIKNIQRTFTFDSKSIYDSFQDIAKEINCLFVIDCYLDSDGKIVREVNVYDLESYCLNCGKRGEFTHVCPECGSKDIVSYGQDTSIFVSTENLADSITYSTDNGSIKNCFKLEAGDDLMTATIINCNPNGSSYIWHISDESKKDMSEELVTKLEAYDTRYDYYQNEYSVNLNSDVLAAYNNLVEKYKVYSQDYSKIQSPIVGYPALMEAYYNVVDFYLYLNNSLMPTVEISNTTAAQQVSKLTASNLSPVAVQNIDVCSAATAESAVLAMAKTVVDDRYQVKISNTAFSDNIWSGIFIVTNYSDEEDTATSSLISIEINDDYESYVKQKINKTLSKVVTDDATDIIQLFSLDDENFINELKKYSLVKLNAFYENCQSCLDILIDQGIANRETWADQTPDMYEELYLPYYRKLGYIELETKIREDEISIIIGSYDADGNLKSIGMQSILDSERDNIRDALNFEQYLGENLWLEFASYRREDTYKNDNYISDGLNNAELFAHANEFIEIAKKDIFKSSTLQHSISSTLKNLLVMKEFSPIVQYFEIGNWIRVRVDENVYRLRLIEYEINFDNLENILIAFSDVTIISDGVSDVKSVLDQANSISTSYGSVSRQAKQGKKSSEQLDDWVFNGLSLTNMKIVDNSDNQNISFDSHGLLCKEYLPITDTYDDKQLKIINKGLYVTNDNWLTSRAGIGEFTFWNPQTGKMEEDYGVIANTLVGNLILSEKVGIYNTENSITLDKNGVIITTTDASENEATKMAFKIQKKETDEAGNDRLTPIMYVDSNGDLVLNGTTKINSAADPTVTILDEIVDTGRYQEIVSQNIHNALYGDNGVYSTIDEKYNDVRAYTESMLNDYKAEVGQYMSFDENGLILGASSSSFKTVIENRRMAFYDGDNVAAYISNSQLNIPNAVIEQTLSLGKFFFSVRQDGGVSLTWQD